MKLNNNHLLIFAFAIAAGLYIWNDRYPGKKEGFYKIKAAPRGIAIACLLFTIVFMVMSFVYAEAARNDSSYTLLYALITFVSCIVVCVLGVIGGGPYRIQAALYGEDYISDYYGR